MTELVWGINQFLRANTTGDSYIGTEFIPGGSSLNVFTFGKRTKKAALAWHPS